MSVAARRGEPGAGHDGVDDAALLALAGRGDEAAFRTLVERHVSLAMGVARRMLRDDAEAEDVAQEAFLRLWRSGERLDIAEHGLGPWLRRVVSNLCIDRVRSGRRLVIVPEIPEEAEPVHQSKTSEGAELSRRVDAALKDLPERQRLALTLFHFEGMSQAEVGTVMGVSGEAVESLLARARRGLKEALRGEWRELIADEAGR